MLQHGGALLLAHGSAGGLVYWNHIKSQKIVLEFFASFLHYLSDKPALVLWYTHPENRNFFKTDFKMFFTS